MSPSASIRSHLAPVHREGLPFIGLFALVSLVLFWLWSPLGWLATVANAVVVYFFRDPDGVDADPRRIVVFSRRRRISRITNAVPPKGARLGERAVPRVSIFMSVFDAT